MNSPGLINQTAAQLGDRVDRIRHTAPENSTVQIFGRTGQPHFCRHDSSQAVRDRRNAVTVLAGIADDRDVGLQAFFVVCQESIQIVAANLFLTFDQKLDVHGQPSGFVHPRLNRLQMGEHLAFVVRGTTSVDLAVANLRFERGRRPEFKRIGRLDVVMSVNQDRG